MYGPRDATLLVLTEARLDQRVINALESAAQALGHADGACIARLSETGDELALFIAQGDPWSVVAIDDASVAALQKSFPPESSRLYPDAPVEVPEGYQLVAVPGFSACLDDQAAKRVAWNRLKAARHPGNPLERQKPAS